MAYEGEILNACGSIQIDFSDTFVVAVSGDKPNLCGHLLIYTAKGGGYYFHVIGDVSASGVINKIHAFPKYMNDAGYRRFLKENGKRELRRRQIKLPNPSGALLYIERLLSEKWWWAILPHNCVTFVEEVITAGGGNWGSSSNCPVIATEDSVSQRIQSFYIWMESEVYGLYGAPR